MLNKIKANFSNLPKYLLKLCKKYSNRLILGQNRSIFKGSGVEFVDIREYIEGDDPRYIDWNVSARMNGLFVRNFQEEREIPIYAVIDLDSSMFFGTKSKLKIDLLQELVAIFINLSQSLHERFGAIISFKQELAFFKPYKNLSQIFKILNFLNNISQDFKKNKEKYMGARSNIVNLLKVANQYIKRTATILIFSSLIDIPSEDLFDKYLRALKKIKNNEVYVFKISDKSEIYLPEVGNITFKDPMTNAIKSFEIDSNISREFQKRSQEKLQKLRKICQKNSVKLFEFFTDDNLESKIFDFLRKKNMA
ncbi:MAG: DUF58 domain-containing protein [bacterium]